MVHPTVIVVGAGIVGASIAYHLARAGARVTVVEAAARAGAGVTGRSFGWLNRVNVPLDGPDHAFDLRCRGVTEWRRLAEEMGDALPVTWPGALIWRDTDAETEALAVYHETRGVAVRRLDPTRVKDREPRLARPPRLAVLAPDDGAVDPAKAAETLILAARDRGAALRWSTWVDGLATRGDRVTGVRIGRWILEADFVVLAGGVETERLAATAGIAVPVRASEAVLLTLQGPPGLVRGIISSPEIEIRQAADGALLCADGPVPDTAKELAYRTAETARRLFTDAPDIAARAGRVGARPRPADGLPILGRHPGAPGLYVAAMHPGVILAPLAGRLAARDLIDEVSSDLLAPFGPDRASLLDPAR
jgi:glycine/D-amino acid oxidase-like deaminating enzyme